MPVDSEIRSDDADGAWAERLAHDHPARQQALAELHGLLVSGARAEAHRRSGSVPDAVRADFDDLCLQAADDALAAVLAKLASFRGDSRFTTWAYKFAIFEVSTRLRRHAWRGRRVDVDDDVWDRMEAPEESFAVEQRQVLRLIREGIDTTLSDRQRLVFTAVVLQEVPIDVLAERLETTRGAIYKRLHDARGKLRRHVETSGYAEYLP